jgi:tetratricopeptide (TPR) repeat protein
VNRKISRLTVCATFAILALVIPTSAQTLVSQDTWKQMDSAKVAFDRGDFGDALRACESVRKRHAAEIASLAQTIRKAIAPVEVRKKGDDIAAIREALVKRDESDALEAIDRALLNRRPEDFNDSIAELLAWLDSQSSYPEIDFLEGTVYEAESEFDIALSFYQKAWEGRILLDNPEDRFTILYRMADVAEMKGDPGSREKYLLLVLTEDPIYGKPGNESQTLLGMIRNLSNEKTTEKFFRLYRHNKPIALKAYRDLAEFYYFESKGRIDRALPVATLAACVSVTELVDAISESDFEFAYATFPDLLKRVGTKKNVADWARKNGAWDSFLTFADVLYDHGERVQAMYLLGVLSSSCPDRAIARRASQDLSRKTEVER